jgi:hypothetical protein
MAYIYDLSDQWAAAGTTFTAIKMNVADTASAAASLLMDLQVGGVSKVSVNKNGTTTWIVGASGASFRTEIDGFGTRTTVNDYEGNLPGITLAGAVLSMSTNALLGWSATNSSQAGQDTILRRDAANTLGQRNGVNAQTFNIYNTYTDASNYERGFMSWASNILTIGAQAAGTGVLRQIRFSASAVELSSGVVFVQSDFNQSIKLHASYGIAWQAGAAGAGTSNVARLSSTLTSGYGVELTTGLRLGAPVLHATTGYTVATLPTTPVVGMTTRVTDATSPTVGSTVTGGGAAAALCWYNGANWTVIGV